MLEHNVNGVSDATMLRAQTQVHHARIYIVVSLVLCLACSWYHRWLTQAACSSFIQVSEAN
jgi:predicted Co/Zn/Cd cation transporter (cation efflux family)